MADQYVALLHPGRHFRRNPQYNIAERGQVAAVFTCQSHRVGADLLGLLQSSHNVGTVPGGRNSDDDILGETQRFDLPGEDLVITVVVSHGREDGCVRGEGNGWQTSAFLQEATDDLRR